MFSSPDRSRLFGRGVRFLPVLLLASLVVTCTDAPSVPDGMGYGSLQIVPQFSFAGATAAADALAEAFELVNRFRMVIHRLPSNELALDTVLVVSPGQDVYDLQVTVEVQSTNEQFSVVITALEGDTELFTADPITVTASSGATGSATTPVAVTMTYSGPGATAVAVDIAPEEMVLGPGSSGTFTATVREESGAAVENVPVSWSTGSGAVATVTDGVVATGVGGGVTSVVVTTPTGLTAEASLYVAVGQLAFARDGHVVVGAVAGTEVEDRTPEAVEAWGAAWGPDGTALYYTEGGVVMKVGAAGYRGSGQWPAVSPDGTKLATEADGTIHFRNEDGTAATAGPMGSAPAWTPEGTHLVVGGGSIEKVKANGQDRETLSSGSGDRLPAVSAAGRVAFLTDAYGITSMDADGSGKTDVLPAGVTSSSRPTWSQDGDLLVYSGSDGLLYIVAADGSTLPMALPQGAGTYPAWQPAGPALSPPALLLEALDPVQPVEGQDVDVVGSGFDWIIPSNTHVFFPGPEGEMEGVVRAVTETVVTTLVPEAVEEGTLRVQTLTGEATIALDPVRRVVSVEITPHGGTITAIDGTLQLTAIPRAVNGDPLDGHTINWSSWDEGIVTVDGTGMATGHSNGSAIIQAEVAGMIDTVTVTVDQAAATIDIYIDFFFEGTPYADSVLYADTFWAFPGDTGTFKAEAKDANGYVVMDAGPNWTSTDEAVGTIDAVTGLGAAIAGGTAFIIAEMDGVADTLFIEVRPDIEGDVHIYVQADLDAFAAGGYGRINGSLFVEGASVTNLDGMESLLQVQGDIFITNNTGLIDISGLSYLTIVEGLEAGFIIADNPMLTAPVLGASPPAPSSTPRLAPGAGGPQLAGHLDPKPGFWLQQVGGSLIIDNNDALTDLDWLSNLLVVWGYMEIGDNDNLQDVDGLVSLEHIGDQLKMWRNESLVSMNAFPVLGDVGYVYLEEPGQRISFPSLQDIWGELYLGDLGLASDTSHHAVEVGFPALQCVSEGIWVYQNPRLQTLDLPALEGVSWMCGEGGEIEGFSSLIPGIPDRSVRRNSASSSEHALSARSARTRRLTQRAEERRELGAALEAKRAERLSQEKLPGGDLPRREVPVFQAGPELGSYNAEYPFLELEGNDALTSVDLSSLTYVEGTFLFWHNPTLTSLNLPALGEVGWDLEILENDLLDDLRAPLLASVGERGSGSLVVYYNPVLPTFTFPMLNYIDNALVVVENSSLVSFALPALVYTGGPGDYYSGCGYYWPYDGGQYSLPQGVVPEPGGYGWVYIEYNDLSGGFDLSSLREVDNVFISWNDGLTSIPSMPNLPEWISIVIYYNDALTNLDGFSTLTKAWEIFISSNAVLTDLSGLSNLTEVGQAGIHLYDNDDLAGVSFPALTVVEGVFNVSLHDNLTSVSADLLTSVGGMSQGFEIYENPQVSTVTFPLLTTIYGTLRIRNTALTNLSGFSALTSDLIDLYIESNTVLTDISGLLELGDTDQAHPIMSGLYITNNTLLTDAAANAFLTALNAKFGGGTAVSTTVVISGNGGVGD